jgi:hypothetical protein
MRRLFLRPDLLIFLSLPIAVICWRPVCFYIGAIIRWDQTNREWGWHTASSPGGETRASVYYSGSLVMLVDTSTGAQRACEDAEWVREKSTDSVTYIAISSDSKTLAIGSKEALGFWETTSGQRVFTFRPFWFNRFCILLLAVAVGVGLRAGLCYFSRSSRCVDMRLSAYRAHLSFQAQSLICGAKLPECRNVTQSRACADGPESEASKPR